MDLQYLSDQEGNHTAVVIPIKEWEKLTDKYDGLKELERKPAGPKPSDFMGMLPSDIADAMHEYVRKSRDEWK